MKERFRIFVRSLLEIQLKRLIIRHKLKVVVVAGSVGKTSTKLAINSVLSQKFRVQTQMGNYNDSVSVPLVAFGLTPPSSIVNPFAWIWRLIVMEFKLWRPRFADILLLELGTDHVGEIPHFATYLRPDVSVITAVTPEHMEYFGSLDAVAKEELSIAQVSQVTILNHDDIANKYRSSHLKDGGKILTYGLRGNPELSFKIVSTDIIAGIAGYLIQNSKHSGQELHLKGFGDPAIKSALAAALVGDELGMKQESVHKGLESISAPAGRMQILEGISGSVIIDDTYNSSPEAAIAALKSLESAKVNGKRIAVMGSMNELGDESARYHKEIGEAYSGVDLLITIGEMANTQLGPAAVAAGLDPTKWKDADSPYAAGEYLQLVVGEGDVILAKGSQNGVFAEEAIKQVLLNPDDASKLVRQSVYWLRTKNRQFGVQ